MAYANPDNFRDGFKHDEWLEHHNKLIDRSAEELIKHNLKKYGSKLPIWMVCEVWDFGCLSKLFDGMKREHQNAIAQKYGVSKGHVFASWLHSLNYLRNVCAHYSRLWNRSMSIRPRKAPRQGELDWNEPFRNDDLLAARPFYCCALSRIYSSGYAPHLLGINVLKRRLTAFRT